MARNPGYEWLFAEDGLSFKEKMISFIRENFKDLLGEDAALLDAPGGLETLREKVGLWLAGLVPAPSRAGA